MLNTSKLRLMIRSLIQEAIETQHFRDRIDLRLLGPDTDFPGMYPTFKKIVFDAIEFLKNDVNFDEKLMLGIWLRCPQVYTAVDKEASKKTGESMKSTGSRLYFVLTKNNTLATLMFEKPERHRLEVDYYVPFEDLKKYVLDNNKNFLTKEDIKIIVGDVPKESEEIIIKINGRKWLLDTEKEVLILRNDPSKFYNIYEILEDKIEGITLSQEQKDEILGYLI